MIRPFRILVASERSQHHRLIEQSFGLSPFSDEVSLLHATTASDVLAIARNERPRAVFLDVSMGMGAGIGLVHFLPSTVPGVLVFAIVPPETPESAHLNEQAAALGAAWVFSGELTGDDVLTVFNRLCPPTRAVSTLPHAPALRQAQTAHEIYAVLESLKQSTLSDDFREFVADLRVAFEHALKIDRAERATLQDSETSAYSFAYFVDVAGRQMDLARRHGRRFSLMTLDLPVVAASPKDAVEMLLTCVRDTDIIARADEREILALLPETGAAGARALRRRVLDRAEGRSISMRVGMATFPVDGDDLSKLLRLARRRAERWAQMELETPSVLARLVEWLAQPEGAEFPLLPEALRPVELAMREAWTLLDVVIRESTRAGDATLTLHAPMTNESASLTLMQGLRSTTGDSPPPSRGLGPMKPVLSLLTGVSKFATTDGVEVASLVAEHGCYALIGRVEDTRLRAFHTSELPFAEALQRSLAHPTIRKGYLTRITSSAPPFHSSSQPAGPDSGAW